MGKNTCGDVPISAHFKNEFTLGEWKVLPDIGQIDNGEEVRQLEPKVMQVLVLLFENAGEVVSKQQLIESVWEGRTVGDEVITRCISVLRSNLGDNPKKPNYIETRPKLGYRLLSAAVNPTVEQAPDPYARPSRKSPAIIALSFLVGLLLIALFYSKTTSQSITKDAPPPPNSVAVLPFTNMMSAEQQYLSDGISEQILSSLGQLPNVTVAAKTSSFRFRQSTLELRDIAQQLGVTTIVEGSVQRSGNTLRVSAQLVDAASGYQYWADSFDDDIEASFALQERISRALINALVQRTPGQEEKQQIRPQSFAAYDAFLRAHYAMNRRSLNELNRAIELFKQSIEEDNQYGPSYIGLANSYALLPSYSTEPPADAYDKAIANLNRGIASGAIIESMAAPVMGFIQFKRGRWMESQAAFEQALADPNPDPNTYQWYSQLLASVGRLGQSLDMAQQGRAADPLSPVANSRLAIAHLWVNENDQAAKYFAIANELGLTTAVHIESFTLLLLRQRSFEKVKQLVSQIESIEGYDDPWFEQAMSAVADPSQRESAVKLVAEAMQQNKIKPRIGMLIWALLEQPERAFATALELAEAGQFFEVELLFIEELQSVRKHQDFEALLNQLDLPTYWQRTGCDWDQGQLKCNATSKF